MTGPTFRVESPRAPGGVALIRLQGDPSPTFASLRLAPVAVGAVALRHLAAVGGLLVARWSDHDAHLMPHGGLAQIAALRELLIQAGANETPEDQPPSRPAPARPTPEDLDAALARIASPRGVDLLLDQPRRWVAGFPNDPAIDRALNHLITPPLVAIIGPANVGKSTLVNALCDRAVSIVADQPGTTRDHVGVTVTLDGLTLRLIDCPGFRDSPDPHSAHLEQHAIDLATRIAAQTDLIIAAADPHTMNFRPPPALGDLSGRLLRISLRADLVGMSIKMGCINGPDLATHQRLYASLFDHVLSVHENQGVEQLKSIIRRRLVPDAALAAPVAWRFWT